MKREIKFRAWNKKCKVMVDVAAMNFGPSGFWSLIEDADDAELQLADSYELMQYTGLKDNNGRSIYEGDIVSFGSVWDNGDNEDLGEEIHIGVVKYDPHYAVYSVNCEESGERRFLFMDVVNYDGFGVIGNIFEDKQLLEGKQ
ncbi:YopX family protein [Lacticaseibacillus paracasei]|uniref:YopX family protein n=1 Tax=Lacticaseibacillus paracasei TaxID=1597 RepID=UPI0022E71BBC|nr:YopX family protein [Lacticaseibacillus paracasei]